MKTKKTSRMAAPIELSWTFSGAWYRLTAWPEVRCERRVSEGWEAVEPDTMLFAAGALSLEQAAWEHYLEYVPEVERSYLRQFRYGRLGALWVVARCPEVLGALLDAPALTAFLAAHVTLRGTAAPRWGEIAAVFERAGVFGVLEWLGLPASRQTLAVLRQLLDPDLPQRLLAPLRTSLWEPATLHLLQHTPRLTDRELARCCQPLAA